jgi:ParB-like chromosome segregation protein Spo0J
MLQHETWPIDKLIEYARNPRKNDHAVDRVAAAIREFGFRVPVVAKSDGTVVDGHLRLKAAKKLGLTEVPVVLADDMTDLQIKAFRLSVNKMAELAEWDDELLALELGELHAADFDMALLGFDASELSIKMGMGADFTPGTEEDQSRLDEKSPITCPACGHEFHK